MSKMARPVVAGDPITFRIPVDTPTEIIDYLNDLKQAKGYGKELARLFLKAVREQLDSGHKVSILLPEHLPAEKQQWLENEESQRLIGQWIYQLLTQRTAIPLPIDGGQEAVETIKLHESTKNLIKGLGLDDD